MKVIGHKNQCELLVKLANRKDIPHALIFAGPEGIGKRRIAQWFAHKILNSSTISNPDIHIVQLEEGKRDIPATALRELRQKLQLKSYGGSKKIAIIDDAHRMSTAACNAFLKTLEEPPGDSLIILITHSPQQLLATVISRCQVFNFTELSISETKEILTGLDLSVEINDLLELSPNNLGILGLSSYCDPLSLELTEKKKAKAHLTMLLDKNKEISALLKQAWEPQELEARLSNKVNAASKLGEEKENIEMVFAIIKSQLRTRLVNSSSTKESRKIAEQMLKVVEIEQLVQERSLNTAIQLAAIL